MKKPRLEKIPNTNNYRIVGLEPSQIEVLKKSTGEKTALVIASFGGISLFIDAISQLNSQETEGFYDEVEEPVVIETDTEIHEDIITPKIDEVIKTIDIDETIHHFEEMELDDDLIDTVIGDDTTTIEMDEKMDEYIHSNTLIDDLNDESGIDGNIIDDDFIEEDEYPIHDEDGYLINENTDSGILRETLDDFRFDKDITDEMIHSGDEVDLSIDNETDEYIHSDEFIEDLNDETDIDGFIINDQFMDDEIPKDNLGEDIFLEDELDEDPSEDEFDDETPSINESDEVQESDDFFEDEYDDEDDSSDFDFDDMPDNL